jgi:hypothetical protein
LQHNPDEVAPSEDEDEPGGLVINDDDDDEQDEGEKESKARRKKNGGRKNNDSEEEESVLRLIAALDEKKKKKKQERGEKAPAAQQPTGEENEGLGRGKRKRKVRKLSSDEENEEAEDGEESEDTTPRKRKRGAGTASLSLFLRSFCAAGTLTCDVRVCSGQGRKGEGCSGGQDQNFAADERSGQGQGQASAGESEARRERDADDQKNESGGGESQARRTPGGRNRGRRRSCLDGPRPEPLPAQRPRSHLALRIVPTTWYTTTHAHDTRHTTARHARHARHDTHDTTRHDAYIRPNAGVKMEIDDQASDLLALEQARLADEEAERLEAEGELLPPPLFPSALVTHTTAELTGLTKKTTGEAPAASSVYRQLTRADVSLFVSTNL